MRIVVLILLFLFSNQSFSENWSGTLNGALTVNIFLGTQLKAINFGVSIFGTSTYKSASVEAGVNLNITPFFQKYGVYQRSFFGSLEIFTLAGYGNNRNLLGSNIGLTKHNAFYDTRVKNDSFYGVGLVAILNNIAGDLKKFENKQGGFLMRFSHQQNSVSINVVNDVSAWPFSKSGSDKGSTARAIISYTTIRDQELFGFGFGIDMFTPLADYGKAPRVLTNSEEGMRLVLVNTKPYDDLFHLNLFSSFVYQNDNNFNVDARFGVDSPKLGAFIQNIIHDNFGLYPRFSWPVKEKTKFYSLLDINTSFNNNLNE